MGDKSTIEWTDATWNPVVGCTRISEGCRHCYAFALHDKRHAAVQAGKALPVQYNKPFSEIQLFWERIKQPLHWRRPRRIFVNSLSDLFHKDVPPEFIINIFKAMEMCPQHIFQILTKRADRMQEIVSALARQWERPFPLPNVWLGVSVENQKAADERIPFLLQTPATVRWLSIEPLLGPIDLTAIRRTQAEGFMRPLDGRFRTIDWVVVGGESGPGARPMHPDWVRALRFQCNSACVPFFFKQWGAWTPSIFADSKSKEFLYGSDQIYLRSDGKVVSRAKGFTNIPAPAMLTGDESVSYMHRVGKKAAGRVLDGRTWDEFPITTEAKQS